MAGADGLLVLATAASALLVRLLLIRVHAHHFRAGFHGDASVHFAIIRHLQREPRSRYVQQYLISPEPMSYPLGFHQLVRWIPLETLRRHSYLPNLVVFVIAATAFAAAGPFLQRTLVGAYSPISSVVAVAVFVLSPSQMVLLGPGIAYLGLSERLLARLSCSAYFLLLLGWMTSMATEAQWIFGVGSAVFGCVTLVSSIFGRQCIFFVSPLVALFGWHWEPLAGAGLAGLLALAVSRDQFIRGIRHTVLTWRLYATHTKQSASVRLALSNFLRLGEIREKWPDVRRMLGVLTRREPTRAMIWFPELLVLAGLQLLPGTPRLPGDAWSLIAAAVGTYLLTSTPWLNHLGEAYRYLEYVLSFAVPLLLAYSVSEGPPVAWVALAMLLCFCLLFFAVTTSLLRKSVDAAEDRLTRFLQPLQLNSDDIVFPVTMRLGADICARTEARSFWWQPGIISTLIYDDFVESYPYLKRDYAPLLQRFGVTHVICEKRALSTDGVRYDFTKFPVIAEDDCYIAYRAEVPDAGTA